MNHLQAEQENVWQCLLSSDGERGTDSGESTSDSPRGNALLRALLPPDVPPATFQRSKKLSTVIKIPSRVNAASVQLRKRVLICSRLVSKRSKR